MSTWIIVIGLVAGIMAVLWLVDVVTDKGVDLAGKALGNEVKKRQRRQP